MYSCLIAARGIQSRPKNRTARLNMRTYYETGLALANLRPCCNCASVNLPPGTSIPPQLQEAASPKLHQPHRSRLSSLTYMYARTNEDFVQKPRESTYLTWTINDFSHESAYLNDLGKQDNERLGTYRRSGGAL